MAFEIIWEPLGIYKRFWGFVSIPELIESVAGPRGDPRFDSLRYVIYDFLAVHAHEITDQAIAGIAAVSIGGHASNPNVRVALLTTDNAIKDLAWQFASLTLASYPIQIFQQPADARAWLQSKPRPGKLNSLLHRPYPARDEGLPALDELSS